MIDVFKMVCAAEKHLRPAFAQVEQIVKRYFVGEVDDTAMTDAAASAMIASLGDPWSYYVSAEEYKAFDERKTNTYVGIGITIQGREDGIGFTIIQVEPDGTAAQAGIMPGDILIEVDGTSMEGVANDVPVNMIRGNPMRPGSFVKRCLV